MEGEWKNGRMEEEYRYLCSAIAIAEIMERSESEFDLLILIY